MSHMFLKVNTAAEVTYNSHSSHLDARQRLVGPNGVPSYHINPVVMDGHSRLVLT